MIKIGECLRALHGEGGSVLLGFANLTAKPRTERFPERFGTVIEADQQRAATASAQQSLDLFTTRYEGGVDTYLQVIVSQTALLVNERNDIDITRRRLEASVLLVKALGGGWNTSQLPQNP